MYNLPFKLDLAVWYSCRFLIQKIPSTLDQPMAWANAVSHVVRANSRYFKVSPTELSNAVAKEMVAVLEGSSTVRYGVDV